MTRPASMVGLAILFLVARGAAHAAAQPPAVAASNKVPFVAVTGCLAEQGGVWVLTKATPPTPSIANAPPAGTLITGPTSGPHEYRLIGTSEFDLPAHRDQTVLIKGLFIKAEPVSRVNVTSVTRVSATCAPAPK